MSSTRRATDGAFHPSRYSRDPEFRYGLPFTCVAPVARQILKNRPADRELVWFVQYLSHQEGGLAAVAEDLVANSSQLFGTKTMTDLSKSPDENYSLSEMEKIRAELPFGLRSEFPLPGKETKAVRIAIFKNCEQIQRDQQSVDSDDLPPHEREIIEGGIQRLRDANRLNQEFLDETENRASNLFSSYTVQKLRQVCIAAAQSDRQPGETTLERELSELCTNPKWQWEAGGPWYFANMLNVLREYKRQRDADHNGLVMTPVVRQVQDLLDYTLAAGGLNLMIGPGNVGARYAARELCRRQSGRVRVFDCPATNDEASFYRGIGKALGGNFTNYKNVQIRERVSELLQSGDLALMVTSSQNLWPQKNLREAFPGRLAWLMEQTEAGAAVCLISGPQFFMQKRSCEKCGWDSPEFASRIHAEALPETLSVEDLTAIAQCALPTASADDCENIAIGAVGSERYLASVDAVVKRAKILSDRAGRNHQTEEDVAQAIHFVSQSDRLLSSAGRKPSQGSMPRKPINAERSFARELTLTTRNRISRLDGKESHV